MHDAQISAKGEFHSAAASRPVSLVLASQHLHSLASALSLSTVAAWEPQLLLPQWVLLAACIHVRQIWIPQVSVLLKVLHPLLQERTAPEMCVSSVLWAARADA